MFDYFYGAQSEQFAFYRVPKVLFTNDRFKYLSAEAKTLYGILLDRVPLSAKNGWIDEQNKKQTPLRQADGGAFSGILQQKGLTPPNR